MRPIYFALPLVLALAACKLSDGTVPDAGASSASALDAAAASNDPLAAHDNTPALQELADSDPRALMQAQVVLDRLGFTPGVVDGKAGLSTRNAVSGFQEANNLTVTGELDEPTTAALQQWNKKIGRAHV